MESNSVDPFIYGFTLSGLEASAVSGWEWGDGDGSDGVTIDTGAVSVPEDNTYLFRVWDADYYSYSWHHDSEYSEIPYTLTVTVN